MCCATAVSGKFRNYCVVELRRPPRGPEWLCRTRLLRRCRQSIIKFCCNVALSDYLLHQQFTPALSAAHLHIPLTRRNEE
ncbi:hypothetical protein L596_027544 [Steinernema carpocapsae]|uniref:Uncharacterized protein n=1 Tax=Steinernema carpocapsae TaxID=34508 RepID=A0A4U5LVS8_STECR|nr:hypothetical protein L596_027544 [Steinernema carpocapsae]